MPSTRSETAGDKKIKKSVSQKTGKGGMRVKREESG